jgi:hypothetical protein
MSRRRDRKGLQVARGERYALLPREVLESVAYLALTDWARTVLIALIVQFHGMNNGTLALPFSQAKNLGVSHPWKLYAGLRLLEAAELILCTRRGRLEGGTKLPSLYAVTWRGIDEPKEVVAFDGGIGPCPIPSQRWARWEKPADWREQCRKVARENHGREKNPVSTTRGYGRSTTHGSRRAKTDQPVVDMERANLAQPMVDTSKTSAVGAVQKGDL